MYSRPEPDPVPRDGGAITKALWAVVVSVGGGPEYRLLRIRASHIDNVSVRERSAGSSGSSSPGCWVLCVSILKMERFSGHIAVVDHATVNRSSQ